MVTKNKLLVFKPGMVANVLSRFQGKAAGEVLPGLSPADMSSAEQTALVDAKKRKNANGEFVGTGPCGSGSSGSEGVGGITKLDIMSRLKEQSEVATHATKILLSEHTEQINSRNTTLLGTFGEGIQEQFV